MDSGRGNIKLKVSRLLLQVKHIQNRCTPPWPSQQEVILQRHAATHGRPLPYGQSDKRPGQVKACQSSLFCEKQSEQCPTHPPNKATEQGMKKQASNWDRMSNSHTLGECIYTHSCTTASILVFFLKKKGDPWTWAVPGQFGPDKAQTWVSEPAAWGENSVLHPPEVLPTQEVSPAFWPNLHNKVKPQARSLSQQHVWERWGREHKG